MRTPRGSLIKFKGSDFMHVVFCTDYNSLVSVTQWVSLQNWDSYVIISSTEELAVRISNSECSVVVFDYTGDREVQSILSAAFFLKDLQVMAGNLMIAKQYRRITDNIFIIPPVIDLGVLFWSNPVFSLNNMEKHKGNVILNCLEDLSNCDASTIQCSTKEDENGGKSITLKISKRNAFQLEKPVAKAYQTYKEFVEPVLDIEAKTKQQDESIADFRKRQLSSIPIDPSVAEIKKSNQEIIDNAKRVLNNTVGSKGLLVRSKWSRNGNPTNDFMGNSYAYFKEFYRIKNYDKLHHFYSNTAAVNAVPFESFLLEKKIIGIDDYLEFMRCTSQCNVLLSNELPSHKYDLYLVPDKDASNIEYRADTSRRMGLVEMISSDKKAFLLDIKSNNIKQYLTMQFNSPLLYFTHRDYILNIIDEILEKQKSNRKED